MDLDAVRAELEQVVRESDATIAVLEAEEADESSDLVEVDPHPSDTASDLSEDDREEALIEAAQVRRAEAVAGLARLDSSSYGSCVDCGKMISEERLSFRPEAARCLADQEAFEAREA